MKNSTVLVVRNLWISVKSTSGGKGLSSAGADLNVLVNLQISTIDVNREGLSSVKSMSISTFPILELERKDSHTNQVASVDSLIALSNNCGDPLELWSFSSPITR